MVIAVDPVALAEALSSRLAHELVGPVGAISNGLELMRELGEEAGEDVTVLIDNSAETAANRLQFYRLAYGRAGFANSSVAQFRSAATAFMAGSDTHTLTWPMPPILPTLQDGAGRISLLLIEIAHASLIRGGTVAVNMEENSVTIKAQGNDIMLSPDLSETLCGNVAQTGISPSNVHGVLASIYAQSIGWTISSNVDSESVILSATSGSN